VVLPAHAATNPYPSSGTVAVDQTTSAASLSLSSRIVLTFNGTSKVGVTLTVDGHTVPGCTIDLSKPTPSCG
jgi:aconitase B